MIRPFLICLLFGAALASCADFRSVVPPESRPECAVPQTDGAKDGGIGGTGKAPETCAETPVVD
jgi:hypothetical protein